MGRIGSLGLRLGWAAETAKRVGRSHLFRRAGDAGNGVPGHNEVPAQSSRWVAVVEDEGRKIGLVADRLLGQQSIVIKSLGASVQNIDGVAGGAIMSDGNVALILDVAGLTRVAHATDTTVRGSAAKIEKASGAAAVEASLAQLDAGEVAASDSDVATEEPEICPVGVDV